MPANTIPGYIMGHRFSDAPECYDSANKRFLDQAGYGSKADLKVTVGSPIFETVSGQRSVKMDNTCHGVFASPIAWQGSMILVIKPIYVSGVTLTRYPILWGDSATPSSNGNVQIVYTSTARRVVMNSASTQLTGILSRTDNNTVVVAFCHDQSTRLQYKSTDGVTVTTSTAAASTVNGNAVALGSAQYGSRWGNLSGTAGNTTPISDFYCNVMEQHFFSENILTGSNLAKTATFMAELKATHGVS